MQHGSIFILLGDLLGDRVTVGHKYGNFPTVAASAAA